MLLEVPPADPDSAEVDRAMVRKIRQRLADVESAPDPYPHFMLDGLVEPAFLTTLLDWLDGAGQWEAVNEGHYSLYRCVNLPEIVSSPARSLVRQPVIDALAAELGRIFGVPLGSRWMYVATNRMQVGQSICVHTDPPDLGGEDVRLVIHLARPEAPVEGGELLLLREKEDAVAKTGVAPIHGATAAFALSHRSFHAVNTIIAGTRNTIVFGFYREGRVPDQLLPATSKRSD